MIICFIRDTAHEDVCKINSLDLCNSSLELIMGSCTYLFEYILIFVIFIQLMLTIHN